VKAKFVFHLFLWAYFFCSFRFSLYAVAASLNGGGPSNVHCAFWTFSPSAVYTWPIKIRYNNWRRPLYGALVVYYANYKHQ